MYYDGQTLRNKTTNELVRMVPGGDSAFAWTNDGFIREDGTTFNDKWNNYTYIVDEWGNPFSASPEKKKKGEKKQFINPENKKYLVSDNKLAEMRKSQYAEQEQIIKEKLREVVKNPTARPCVGCPFKNRLIGRFFKLVVGAFPLYSFFGYNEELIPGEEVFFFEDNWWIIERMHSDRLTLMYDLNMSLNKLTRIPLSTEEAIQKVEDYLNSEEYLKIFRIKISNGVS